MRVVLEVNMSDVPDMRNSSLSKILDDLKAFTNETPDPVHLLIEKDDDRHEIHRNGFPVPGEARVGLSRNGKDTISTLANINQLGLSQRAHNLLALQSAKYAPKGLPPIVTVEDLLQWNAEELCGIYHFGEYCLSDVRKCLKFYGLYLKGDPDAD